jgi:hypothetical protein
VLRASGRPAPRHLTRGGPDGQLLYALDTDTVGGLFEYAPREDQERRVFHRNRFRARDLCRHPVDGTLAFSVGHDDGSANIAVMESEGRGPREVTEGDSVDEAPSWSAASATAGMSRAVAFQSAGVGRNVAGHRIALGPYCVQRLDLDSGDMTVLLEDDQTDYLVPREAADGTLYYIRRPHQPAIAAPSPLKVIGDIVLFPFRLALAILHFLNFFSLMFSRKPLITAGGPPKEGPDTRSMMLWGKMIDAEKALRESKKSGGGKALVPKSWELVRRSPDGSEWVAARGVVSFDLCPNGNLVYTDGTTVYHLTPDGQPTALCDGTLIEHVTLA